MLKLRGSTTFETVQVGWLGHASMKLQDSDGFTVYIDPWSNVLPDQEFAEMDRADIIITTHDHHDHFDKEAVQALKKMDTIVVCTEESEEDIPSDISYDILKPNRRVKSHGREIRGFHAYNIDKFRSPDVPYHPKGFCVGVLFDLNGLTFYHASDTDPIPEMEKLVDEDIDIAFLPVGGTYTMDQEEAIEAIKMIKPEKVVPMHYGFIDETTCDTEKFVEDVNEQTEAEPVILDQNEPYKRER